MLAAMLGTAEQTTRARTHGLLVNHLVLLAGVLLPTLSSKQQHATCTAAAASPLPRVLYLHGVHCNVNASIKQGLVNLLGEQALATNVSQGLAQDLVTGGLDDDDLKGTLLGKLWEVGLRPKQSTPSQQV